jgi:preprotein translocase SecY subunit
MGAFGNFIRSVVTILPEVPKPIRKTSLSEKLIWSAIALALYLVMAQIPLYGVALPGQDQFAYTRVIFASAQGTLMELGIGPIVTAGLILQLLKGADILKIDFKKPEDRALFTSATKLLTLVVILVEALAFMIGGSFGTNLTAVSSSIIILQLFFAGILVMLLDELVQKGWGLGSGISLFIAAGVAQHIAWNTLSILPTGEGYLGVIPYAVNATLAGVPAQALYRYGGLPSIFTLLLTILVIVVIIYMEGVRIEIPVTSTKYRGFAGVYPMKLLYVSVIPVILTSALLANITFFSQFIWSRFNQGNQNPFLNWLVTYTTTTSSTGQTTVTGPTGGLVYYLTSPRTLEGVAGNPLQAVTFTIFLVAFAVLFAKIWVEVGGLSPKAAAKSLIDAEVQVPGFRRTGLSVEAILSKYIPTLTILSGAIIGLLAATSDLLGVFGSGTGILLMVGIILQYYQLLMKEQLETMMPRLAGIFGR